MEEGRQGLFYLSVVLQNAFLALKRNGEQVLTEDILPLSPEKPMIMPRCISSAMLLI